MTQDNAFVRGFAVALNTIADGAGIVALVQGKAAHAFSPRDAEALTLKDACLLVVAIVLSVTIVQQWL